MASCWTPMSVKPKKGQPVRDGFAYHVVPCGKCGACRLRRIQGWVFRLMQEEKIHRHAWFVTFTYDQPPISFNGFMTLHKPDLQNFFKRLRFNTKCKTIKYYACGEYGGKTLRPHYHAIIFDASPDDIEVAWSQKSTEDSSSLRGHLHFGKVTKDSIAYTAKYMAKSGKIPIHDSDDRVKEFSLMSKKLGANYIQSIPIQKYHKNNFISHLTQDGGATFAMPRYYRDKLFTDSEKKHMNETIYDKHDKIFNDEVKRLGSVQEYYRVHHEAVRAANQQFNKQDNRNKI